MSEGTSSITHQMHEIAVEIAKDYAETAWEEGYTLADVDLVDTTRRFMEDVDSDIKAKLNSEELAMWGAFFAMRLHSYLPKESKEVSE
jgi:hypothetical protein